MDLMTDNLLEYPLTWLIFGILVLVIIFNGDNFDMGTHDDTSRKVKSLNTSEGKRLRSRRAYYKRKYEETGNEKYLDKYNDTWK